MMPQEVLIEPVEPGQRLTLQSDAETIFSLRIRTSADTVVSTTLRRGGEIVITAGTESVYVEIRGADISLLNVIRH